jgi:hypothetical protein
MTLDLEVNEVEVKVLTSLASVTKITAPGVPTLQGHDGSYFCSFVSAPRDSPGHDGRYFCSF